MVNYMDQKGSNQDVEISQFGVKYQDLFLQSGFCDAADFIKQNKQFDFMAYPNRSHSVSEGKNTVLS